MIHPSFQPVVLSEQSKAQESRDGMCEHFCSLARPEQTTNRPPQPGCSKLQPIFWPVPARGQYDKVTSNAK